MIHPLIDITKPIRLTTYGEKLFPEVINKEVAFLCKSFRGLLLRVNINGLSKSFNKNGFWVADISHIAIENYEPIKQESPEAASALVDAYAMAVLNYNSGKNFRFGELQEARAALIASLTGKGEAINTSESSV